MHELLGKPTVHTYVEEAEAYGELRRAASRIGILLANMGIESLAKRFRDVIYRAEEIVSEGIAKTDGNNNNSNDNSQPEVRPLIS